MFIFVVISFVRCTSLIAFHVCTYSMGIKTSNFRFYCCCYCWVLADGGATFFHSFLYMLCISIVIFLIFMLFLLLLMIFFLFLHFRTFFFCRICVWIRYNFFLSIISFVHSLSWLILGKINVVPLFHKFNLNLRSRRNLKGRRSKSKQTVEKELEKCLAERQIYIVAVVSDDGEMVWWLYGGSVHHRKR